MKFGHFLYHTNLDPSANGQAIQEALAEARLDSIAKRPV